MAQRREVRTVQSEVSTAFGIARLVQVEWPEAVEFDILPPHHALQLSVMPQVRETHASFPRRWGPHRFVQMGEVFFFPAGQEIRVRPAAQLQHSVVCFFDPAAAARLFTPDIQWTDSRLTACLDIGSAVVRSLLFKIGQELRAPGLGSEMLVEVLIGEVMIEAARHLLDVDAVEVSGGLAPWRMKRIDDRLRTDETPPTLSELARSCHLSVRHLTRAFRASRGRSIRDYIVEHRIERAKMLLLSGMPVKSVAAQMRFTAPNNFTAAFRRSTGETPRDFLTRRLR